jgi:hypothetical protein
MHGVSDMTSTVARNFFGDESNLGERGFDWKEKRFIGE